MVNLKYKTLGEQTENKYPISKNFESQTNG